MNKGFTLIEVIIYIALLAFVLGAGLATAFYLINASASGKSETNTIAEGEFLMREIDWALTGAKSIDLAEPGVLKVLKNEEEIKFDLELERARITVDSATPINLTSSNVKVTSFEFIAVPPEGVTARATIDGRLFEITKYLRQ